jgi:hypothetical protein
VNTAAWPEAWADLDVCPKRGLPIPYSTARAPDGTGRFSVNDVARKVRCGRERRCGVCALPLGWWVVFFTEQHGVELRCPVFTDAPLHEACAEASLEGACPYIYRPRVPRRPEPGAAAPWCFGPGQPKAGWLMHVTHSYEMVPQPAAGGGTVWAFRPGPAKRTRRFAYGADGVLREERL